MNRPKIRRASVTDAETLVDVYHSAYRENRELGFPAKAESVSESDIAEWIRTNRVYVAEGDDGVVGGVRLETTDEDRVKLSRFGVHEDWKGEGIGSRLLEYVEDVVRADGYATIWLTTPGEHPFLPDLYRRRGYEKTGEYPLDFRRYDEIVMEKRVRDRR
ncbi:GNAT family N-acetyltransferase [Haladaptatus sp. DYF46]|uniref:GNAT family N-acetyltransferase n=1 Tax=Haladaptatus sp. DYF46 TaxID=2886041 RepID=UPI001E5A5F00|nr:GNAT family N-acetyltransferase [Haladaptatus sp. DYF46]